jgi:hypothetical protein
MSSPIPPDSGMEIVRCNGLISAASEGRKPNDISSGFGEDLFFLDALQQLKHFLQQAE